MALISHIPKPVAYSAFIFAAFFVIFGATAAKYFYYVPEDPEQFREAIDLMDIEVDNVIRVDDAPPELQEQYRLLDQNKDGIVSQEEQDYPPGDENTPLQRVVRMQDVNGDGMLDKSESHERLVKNFFMVDHNKDGFIDQTEAKRIDKLRGLE